MSTLPQMLKQLRLTRIPLPALHTLVLSARTLSFSFGFSFFGGLFRALEGCGAEFFLGWGGGFGGVFGRLRRRVGSSGCGWRRGIRGTRVVGGGG